MSSHDRIINIVESLQDEYPNEKIPDEAIRYILTGEQLTTTEQRIVYSKVHGVNKILGV